MKFNVFCFLTIFFVCACNNNAGSFYIFTYPKASSYPPPAGEKITDLLHVVRVDMVSSNSALQPDRYRVIISIENPKIGKKIYSDSKIMNLTLPLRVKIEWQGDDRFCLFFRDHQRLCYRQKLKSNQWELDEAGGR